MTGLLHFRWVWIFNILVMLKIRYRRSVLGFFWSMLGPFSSYAVIATVFYFNSSRDFNDFLSRALPGFLMFNFALSALNNSPHILTTNENFLRKIYLPKSVFFFGSVASDFVNYLFAQFIVMIVVYVFGFVEIQPTVLLLPVFWVLIFTFLLGISLTIGTLTVFFRDISHIVPIATQIIFYLTPVLYSKTQMPLWIENVINLNPFTHYLALYRGLLFDVPYSLFPVLGVCTALSLLSLVLGFVVLQINNDRIIYYL